MKERCCHWPLHTICLRRTLSLICITSWSSCGRDYKMLLCNKIKIEVSQQDAEALEFMQAKCRGVCNWWIMKLRNGERWNLEKAKQSLQASKAYDQELHFVYGRLLAEANFRLDNAMQG